MLKRFTVTGQQLVESVESGGVLTAIAPNDSERAFLQDAFSLDDYDLASTLDQDEVPRLDASSDRLLLIWKVPDTATIADVVELGVSVVGLALAKEKLVLIRNTGDIAFSDREFRALREPQDVILAFMLNTVRHYVGHLRVIRQLSSELERKITVSMENRHLLQMFALSESLVYYIDAIEGNAAALARLRNVAAQYGFQQRHLDLLDDIILENAQAARQADIFSSVLSGLMDARASIVNNNMNVLLKNLMLISIVFLPLNLIASIGGMSEWTMMTSGMRWPIAYAVFCMAMVLFGWATWLFVTRIVDQGTLQDRPRRRRKST